MSLIFKNVFVFVFVSLNVHSQQYLFNAKNDTVLYTNYVNIVFIREGTPLNFDGTLHFEPTLKQGLYYTSILDTVTREKGNLNITAYIDKPEGGTEKVFIDKFPFKIKKGPKPILFLGKSISGLQADTADLHMRIGFKESTLSAEYQIVEISLILNKKEVITLKNSALTSQVQRTIKRLAPGSELRISVVYKDLLKRKNRVGGVFYL